MTVSAKRAFGYVDAPLVEQYFTYIKGLFRGDLGISVSYFPERVTTMIGEGLFWTVLLSGASVL